MKMRLDKFEYELLRFVKEEKLISPGERVVLAVSGGADSVALMYALASIKGDLDAEFVVAHLNHRIRKEAESEGPAVSEMAKKLGMVCVVESVDVPSYKRSHKGLSLEEAARKVRYDFFRRVMEKHHASKVATAHHLSDLTENFFLRLFRGSGIGGLVGMSPKNGEYIKPFLNFDEKKIREYVTIKRLRFFEDRTNFDTRYTRNKIRHVLIPEIKNEFCSNIEETIKQTVNVLRDYQNFVHQKVMEIFSGSFFRDGHLVFRLEDLRSVERILLSEVLKETFIRFGLNISHRKIEGALKVVESFGEGEMDLGKNVYMVKDRQFLSFGPRVNPTAWSGILELIVPGRVKIQELSLEIEAYIKENDGKFGDTKTCVLLDAEKVEFPLCVRTSLPGEKIVPLGMKGRKKIRDILKENKVPKDLRDVFPVVSQMNGKIVWVIGMAMPDGLKLTNFTKKVLVLIREGGNF